MLSFRRGLPIAIINGGKYNNKILHILDPNEKCCDQCTEECGKYGESCCEDCPGRGGCLKCNRQSEPELEPEDPFEILGEDFVQGKRKRDKKRLEIIKKAILKEKEPEDRELGIVYGSAMKELKRKRETDFQILEEGEVQVLPNFEKSERLYVTGPSDSGKSYYIGKFIEQWKKVFKTGRIFIFSDVDEDKSLDRFSNVTRVIINKELMENPMRSEEFPEGCLVIFDDIDSIVDKKLLATVEGLRDHLLHRGRHERISVIVSNHLTTDYKRTKIVLNECTSVTVFPMSGATYGIEYMLRKYCGFDPKQIKRLMSLRSRWVTVKKNCPIHVIYNKGVYLL
jgi:hypothetical protein